MKDIKIEWVKESERVFVVSVWANKRKPYRIYFKEEDDGGIVSPCDICLYGLPWCTEMRYPGIKGSFRDFCFELQFFRFVVENKINISHVYVISKNRVG